MLFEEVWGLIRFQEQEVDGALPQLVKSSEELEAGTT